MGRQVKIINRLEKLLTEELLKQIKLINYDRSKTLLEQFEKTINQPSDYLGDDGVCR